jgi:hypothetical protein
MSEKEKASPYSKFVTQLIGVTETFLGVKVPDNTKQTWESLYQLIHLIDDRYDKEPDPQKRQLIAENTVKFIAEYNTPYPYPDDQEIKLAKHLKETVWQQREPNVADFAEKMSRVFSTTESLRQTKSPAQYTHFTLLDGANCAVLFTQLLPAKIQVTPGSKNFEKFLKHLAAVHKTKDSIQDFPEDFSNGQTEIAPSNIAYAHLAIGLIKELPKIAFYGGLTIFSSRTRTYLS